METQRLSVDGAFSALPTGTVLDRYRIDSVLAAGGFGITYLCHHTALGKLYALKEHFPRQFAYREGTTSQVRPSDPGTFSWTLDRFLQEGRSLARCAHPNVVAVADVFEANGTAYMVLGYEQGQSLRSWLEALGRPPTQAEIDRLLVPILDALEYVHGVGLLHRDIAPDNIMIRPDGSPCLIDFGAARQAVAERSQVMSAVVKGGYSPPEQYTRSGRSQGPWSDIYALAATLYRALTGVAPQESPERQIDDELKPIAQALASRGGRGPGGADDPAAAYRPEFLAAIDRALRLRHSERPQSIAAWRAMLLPGFAAAPVEFSALPRAPGSPPPESVTRAPDQPSVKRSVPMFAAAVAIAAVAVAAASAGWWLSRAPEPPTAARSAATDRPSPVAPAAPVAAAPASVSPTAPAQTSPVETAQPPAASQQQAPPRDVRPAAAPPASDEAARAAEAERRRAEVARQTALAEEQRRLEAARQQAEAEAARRRTEEAARAAAEARARSEAEARRRAEEEARIAAEARARAEAEIRRLEQEAEARRRAEAERQAAAEADRRAAAAAEAERRRLATAAPAAPTDQPPAAAASAPAATAVTTPEPTLTQPAPPGPGPQDPPAATGSPAVATPPPALDVANAEAALALQRELKRVGCYDGPLDGSWGPGSAQAFREFLQHSRAGPAATPTAAHLEQARAATGRICPLACGPDERIVGDRCVAIAKPAPPRKAPAAAKPAQSPPQRAQPNCGAYIACLALYPPGRGVMHCQRPAGC